MSKFKWEIRDRGAECKVLGDLIILNVRGILKNGWSESIKENVECWEAEIIGNSYQCGDGIHTVGEYETLEEAISKLEIVYQFRLMAEFARYIKNDMYD